MTARDLEKLQEESDWPIRRDVDSDMSTAPQWSIFKGGQLSLSTAQRCLLRKNVIFLK